MINLVAINQKATGERHEAGALIISRAASTQEKNRTARRGRAVDFARTMRAQSPSLTAKRPARDFLRRHTGALAGDPLSRVAVNLCGVVKRYHGSLISSSSLFNSRPRTHMKSIR